MIQVASRDATTAGEGSCFLPLHAHLLGVASTVAAPCAVTPDDLLDYGFLLILQAIFASW